MPAEPIMAIPAFWFPEMTAARLDSISLRPNHISDATRYDGGGALRLLARPRRSSASSETTLNLHLRDLPVVTFSPVCMCATFITVPDVPMLVNDIFLKWSAKRNIASFFAYHVCRLGNWRCRQIGNVIAMILQPQQFSLRAAKFTRSCARPLVSFQH